METYDNKLHVLHAANQCNIMFGYSDFQNCFKVILQMYLEFSVTLCLIAKLNGKDITLASSHAKKIVIRNRTSFAYASK